MASVSVSPSANSMSVGQTVALTAALRDAAGNVLTGRQVQWTTSNASVATVSTTGVVTALAAGVAIVEAESEGKSGQSQITVAPVHVPVARVDVTPAPVVLDVGRTRQLTALAFDAGGNVLEGRAIEWTTDAPAVATVSASGVVRAVAHGYATIRATVEGKSGAAAVTVSEPEPAVEFDLVYEQRAFTQLSVTNRISLANGAITALPLVMTIPRTFVREAAPSPDGTRVAFTLAWYPDDSPTLDSDIYVVGIDGRNLQRLTTTDEPDDQPAWSPDGSRIAFSSSHDGLLAHIYTMKPDGTGITKHTTGAEENTYPRWLRVR